MLEEAEEACKFTPTIPLDCEWTMTSTQPPAGLSLTCFYQGILVHLFFYIRVFCLYECKYTMDMFVTQEATEGGVRSLGSGTADGCEMPCGYCRHEACFQGVKFTCVIQMPISLLSYLHILFQSAHSV